MSFFYFLPVRLQFPLFNVNSISVQNVKLVKALLYCNVHDSRSSVHDKCEWNRLCVNCNGTVNTLRHLRQAKAVSRDHSVGGLRKALTHPTTKSQRHNEEWVRVWVFIYPRRVLQATHFSSILNSPQGSDWSSKSSPLDIWSSLWLD